MPGIWGECRPSFLRSLTFPPSFFPLDLCFFADRDCTSTGARLTRGLPRLTASKGPPHRHKLAIGPRGLRDEPVDTAEQPNAASLSRGIHSWYSSLAVADFRARSYDGALDGRNCGGTLVAL